MTLTSQLALHVTGPLPDVAPGTITVPDQLLPATGDGSQPWLLAFGLALILAVLVLGARRKRRWWLAGGLLLGLLCWQAPLAAHAASTPIPEVPLSQVTFTGDPLLPSTPDGTLGVNGFLSETAGSQTFAGTARHTTINTPQDLTAYYFRPAIINIGGPEALNFLMRIWYVRLDKGRYIATKVFDQRQRLAVNGTRYQVPFAFTPTKAGQYVIQYSSDATYFGKTVATAPARLLVAAPLQTLNIQAPPIIIPTNEQPYRGTAHTEPIDATDPIQWTTSGNLHLPTVLTGRTVALRGIESTAVNMSATRPGFSATLSASAGALKATPVQHTVNVGGLPAYTGTWPDLQAHGLTHTPQGLAALAAEWPGAKWHYDWQISDTHHNAQQEPTAVSDSAQSLSSLGVPAASGDTTQLSDDAVALTIPPDAAVLRRLADDAPALQLRLQTQVNGKQITATTNYAGVIISRPQDALSLSLDRLRLTWRFSRLQLYDRTPQAPEVPVTLTVEDHQPQPGWVLSAELKKWPSQKDFPFALQISDAAAPLTLDGGARVIMRSTQPHFHQPLAMTLTPTAEAAQIQTTNLLASIEWTLSPAVDAAALSR